MIEDAWRAVAEAAGIGAGTAVLDVGCGTGGFGALAAARGARVHGLDASATAIETARRRVPAGDFRVGLMEELPWPDRSFDVVAGFNAFQYALDVDLALAEAQRVARPGGRLVICKWARPHESELFAFLLALGANRRFPATDLMDRAVARADVDVVATDHVSMTMHMPDEAALEAAVLAAGGDRRRLRQAAAPFRQPDGSYRFHNRLRYVIARA